jgi:predicted NAD/FAD-dependent oxidoreductase
MDKTRIAVIGAGISGLACAVELARADARVTVFERSRRLGGRLGTRHSGDFVFDHGAQFITARSRPFVRFAEIATRAGALGTWKPRVLEDGRLLGEPFEDWMVGVPSMASLVRPLARNIDLQTGVAVHELLQGQRGWELQTDSGRPSSVFSAVVVAVPAPQAITLLGSHGRTFRHLIDVRMAPCWSALMAFEQPLEAGAEAMRWTQGPISWAACNTSKPGRAAGQQCWVVHATPQWSREHLEADARDAAGLLLNEFARALGREIAPPIHLDAYRWRHAFVEQALGLPCLVDEELAAGACGDWCIAPRVEAAFESGRALAHSMLSMAGLSAPATRR